MKPIILEHPENTPKIICTIGGEDYEAEDVRVYEQGMNMSFQVRLIRRKKKKWNPGNLEKCS